MEVNPLNIFFVKSDSKGDRLLFRYPYTTENKDESKQKKCGRQNPYAINSTTEDLLQNPQSQTSNICKGQLSGFTDEMLSTLFAVKAELCNRKFELKVNDVRFVGHPTLLPYRSNQGDNAAMILINIVFALQASASHSIVKCYYDLSKRLGKALRHEEKRCSYLTEEMKIMLATHDEISSLDSELNSGENDDEEDNSRNSVSTTTFTIENGTGERPRSAFHLILQRSSLARSMKAVFEELSRTGIVQVRINKYVLLSFCLPHKAHQIHNRGLIIEPETIAKCKQKLRPYHGLLLMVNPNDLLASIPLDGSAALLRLIKLYSPLKSLQTLAIEADLTLTQVFHLTGHLVYWAKATVIYPLCEGNVYVVAPCANVHIHSPLVEEFAKEFPGLCLLQLLGEFSLPAPLWYVSRGSGAGAAGGARLARIVAWLLRRRLLLQLHTYVHFNSHWGRDMDGKEYFCEKHDIYNQSCSVSFSSLNHMQLNVPEPVEPRVSSNTFPDSDEEYPTENNLNQTDFSHTKPIVIESDYSKYDKYNVVDSANHSFEDGIDVVDGIVKENGCDYDKNDNVQKNHGNSIDSGFSGKVNGTVNGENGDIVAENTNELEKVRPKTLPSILSDLSIRDSETTKILPSRLSDLSIRDSETTKILPTRLSDLSLRDSETTNTLPSRLSDLSLRDSETKKTFPSRLSDLSLRDSETTKILPSRLSDLSLRDSETTKILPSRLSDLSLRDSETTKTLPSRLSDLSLRDSETTMIRDISSDDDKFESDSDISPRLKLATGLPIGGEKNGVSLNLRLQSEMSFQPPTVWNMPASCDVVDACRAPIEPPSTESLLDTFTAEERAALAALPAAKHADDLLLLAQLHKKGYFRGEQHLEEIMFMENVTRSQLMQLLDKFKDILITFETEDPTVSMLYPY